MDHTLPGRTRDTFTRNTALPKENNGTVLLAKIDKMSNKWQTEHMNVHFGTTDKIAFCPTTSMLAAIFTKY